MDKATPGAVEADHIPPKESVNKLLEHLENNSDRNTLFREQHPALHQLVMGKDKRGSNLICMNTLYWDHRAALTTGNSKESKACRSPHHHPKLFSTYTYYPSICCHF